MGKRLIVAEKPSVGRDIANVLNCRENGDGFRAGEHDVVTWAVGHLVGLCYPDELDEKYVDWKMENLPIFPSPFQLKVLESGEKQFEVVKSWMQDPDVDSIVCATDAGREGELIFRYIYQMTGCTKPVERLWISSMTFRAIKEGFENLKPDSEYDHLYESAKCRSEADWLVGMNGSRAYAITNDMRRLSVGRVLSPTLSILVKRELERRNFVPEEYCEVIVSFGDYKGKLLCPDDKDAQECFRFSMKQKRELERFVKDHSTTGKVVSAEYNEEQQPANLLYDLTSLQRDANRIYGMSSKWTLDTAQSLYERHKAITYPRTDSRYLSADIKSTLQKRLEGLLVGDWEDMARKALDSPKDLFGRFINNKGVSDHHAIIPTGEIKGMDSWSKQEKQIFDLIARRFIAMFYPDRSVVHQIIKTDIDGRIIVSNGIKVISEGWGIVDKSRSKGSQELPDLDVGDVVVVDGVRLRTDKTHPPAPHTEASLLAAMEHAGKIVHEDEDNTVETEFGIGTPATRAATIEKMIDKEMATRHGRALYPTEYGIKLISILPEDLRSPEMTGEWEARLARISQGKESPDEFMSDIQNLTKSVISEAVSKGNTGIKEKIYVGECPICGSFVKEWPNAYYCINKGCTFRKVYRAKWGLYPTIRSITMTELLANGRAETDKGTFTLFFTSPFIKFEPAPKVIPDYNKLKELIDDYGVETVNKVPNGGGFWVAGDKHDEMVLDFVRDCKEANCIFGFAKDSKALKHGSGWCHRVDTEFLPAYEEVFGKIKKVATTPPPKDVMDLIKDSGFEYIDKRPKGCLWIVVGKNEGQELIDKCKKLGVLFEFTEKGGRASGHRPAWYSKK